MKRLILILMMCWGLSTAAEAQNSVSGKVVDENYQPIPGVRVSSTKKNGPSTLTDLDGQFSMEDAKRPRRVRAEYVGFTTKTAGKTKYPVYIRMRSENAIRYQGEFSVGYVADCGLTGYRAAAVKGLYDYSTFFLETTHGIRCGKYLYTGVGMRLGVNATDEQEMVIATPTLNLRGYLPIRRNLSLYLGIDLGYSFMNPYDDRLEGSSVYWNYDEWTGTQEQLDYYFFVPQGAFYASYSVGAIYNHVTLSIGLQQLSILNNGYQTYHSNGHDVNSLVDQPKVTNIGFFVKLGFVW